MFVKENPDRKNIYVQINEEPWVAMDSIRLDIIVAIYCYLRKEIYRVLKCHMKSSSYFEIRASLSFKCRPAPQCFKINKRARRLLEKKRYIETELLWPMRLKVKKYIYFILMKTIFSWYFERGKKLILRWVCSIECVCKA